MKNLTLSETNHISGGEKFISITQTIDIDGVPAACIEKFFNNPNITLVGVTEDTLIKTLISGCDAFWAQPSPHYTSCEYDSFRYSLIEA